MKKIILITALISLTVNCQKKEQKNMQNEKITSNNIVEEIVKNIKHYPSEKIYRLDYESYYSFFEVFINDMPIESYFDNFSSGSAFEINPRIFKSGKYEVFYKMYPVGKVENKIFSSLRENSYLDFTLSSYDIKNKDASDIAYSNYKTPMNKIQISEKYSEEKFVGAGKTYYEGSFEIDVQVPYEIHPAFEKGQDLRKLDPITLKVLLLRKYKEVWNIYQNKEYDNIARISYDSMKDELVSKYASKEDVEYYWNTLLTSYKSDTFQMQPIENYKMEFFANGKLVALMLTTQDNRYRGNTALWARVNHDGGMRPLFLNHYFYIPEGETEFKVY